MQPATESARRTAAVVATFLKDLRRGNADRIRYTLRKAGRQCGFPKTARHTGTFDSPQARSGCQGPGLFLMRAGQMGLRDPGKNRSPKWDQNWIKWAMVLFPAIGFLLWLGFLFAVWVLCLILWFLCHIVVWSVDAYDWHSRRGKAAAPRRKLPLARKPAASERKVTPIPAISETTPDIIPKWNAAHRRYVDRNLADWQEQFDALNHRP